MIKSVLPLLLLMSILLSALVHAQRIICDETCKTEFQQLAERGDSLMKTSGMM